MRLIGVVLLGSFVFFALTVVGEMGVMSLRDTGMRLPYFEAALLFPLVALVVGT